MTTQFSQSDEQFESSEIWEITENNEKIHISKEKTPSLEIPFSEKQK